MFINQSDLNIFASYTLEDPVTEMMFGVTSATPIYRSTDRGINCKLYGGG